MDRIKCGKCQSEYSPRMKSRYQYAGLYIPSHAEYDYSCPVCNHGSVKENIQNQPSKQILKDVKDFSKKGVLND